MYDGATPSANAVMMNNIIYLSSVINQENEITDYKILVKDNITALQKAIVSYPTSFGVWAINVQLLIQDIKEINISGGDVEHEINVIVNWYIPEKLIIYNDSNKVVNNSSFTTENAVISNENKSVFRVCTKYTCSVYFVNLTDFYNYITKA